jgi:hypothetical protein
MLRAPPLKKSESEGECASELEIYWALGAGARGVEGGVEFELMAP